MTTLALMDLKLPASLSDQHGNIPRTKNFQHEISSDSLRSYFLAVNEHAE